jgi:hypothetical protein
MKLLVMQFSPLSCHFIALQCKYSPQHPVLKKPINPVILRALRPVSTTRKSASIEIIMDCGMWYLLVLSESLDPSGTRTPTPQYSSSHSLYRLPYRGSEL